MAGLVSRKNSYVVRNVTGPDSVSSERTELLSVATSPRHNPTKDNEIKDFTIIGWMDDDLAQQMTGITEKILQNELNSSDLDSFKAEIKEQLQEHMDTELESDDLKECESIQRNLNAFLDELMQAVIDLNEIIDTVPKDIKPKVSNSTIHYDKDNQDIQIIKSSIRSFKELSSSLIVLKLFKGELRDVDSFNMKVKCAFFRTLFHEVMLDPKRYSELSSKLDEKLKKIADVFKKLHLFGADMKKSYVDIAKDEVKRDDGILGNIRTMFGLSVEHNHLILEKITEKVKAWSE